MNENDDHPVENLGIATYADNTGLRLARLESRVSVVEVDVAVIRSSFATKEDLHHVHRELLGSIQGLELVVREQHMEILGAIHKQREEFHAAISQQREEFRDAHHQQREEFRATHHQQREEILTAVHEQSKQLLNVVHEQRADMLKFMAMQAWRLYAFGAVLAGGIYFIARNVP